MTVELELPFFGKNDRRDLELPALAKLYAIEASEGGRDLVLRADIFSDYLLLHVNCLIRELLFRNVPALQRAQGMD